MELGRRRAPGERDVKAAARGERGAGAIHPQAGAGARQRDRVGRDHDVRPGAVAHAGCPWPVSAGCPAANQALVPPITLTIGPGWRRATRLAAMDER